MIADARELACNALDIDERGMVTTDRLVEHLREEQAQRLSDFDEPPTFAVMQSRAADPSARDLANDSYARQLVAYGNTIGVTVAHEVLPDDFSVIRRIHEINHSNEPTPILPLLPAQTPDGSRQITQAMLPHRDPDSTNIRKGLFVPATAEAMLLTAEAMTGLRLDDWHTQQLTVGYVGYGDRTIRPLNERLIQNKAAIGVMLTKPADIEGIDEHIEALRACDIIFSGVPKAAVLRADHVSENTFIVDVGQGSHPETGRPAGNLDEDVFAINGVRATRLRRGVGPITTAVIYDRVINLHGTPPDRQPAAMSRPTLLAS